MHTQSLSHLLFLMLRSTYSRSVKKTGPSEFDLNIIKCYIFCYFIILRNWAFWPSVRVQASLTCLKTGDNKINCNELSERDGNFIRRAVINDIPQTVVDNHLCLCSCVFRMTHPMWHTSTSCTSQKNAFIVTM